MSHTFLAFGDVFRYRETDFVYLAGSESVTYAAKILNPRESIELDRAAENAAKRGRPTHEMPVYCFVILQTETYKGRAAHFGWPEQEGLSNIEKIRTLIEEDRLELTKDILESRGVPIKLKELVQQIQEKAVTISRK